MSISKSVDKILVNGSEQFVYTIEFVFSDLTIPNEEGYITDFFPSNIEFSDPINGESEIVKFIEKSEVEGGTYVTYNLGSVSDGTYGTFNFFANFGPGRANGDTFTNEVSMYSGEVLLETAEAEAVTLVLDDNFSLSKTIEIKSDYFAGDILDVTLRLTNTNDTGAEILNVIIEDILPSGLSAVETFTPIGQDIEVDGYSDETYTNKEGVWSNNTLSFELPSYSGAMYEMTFQVKIDEDVEDGQVIENIGTWSVDGQARVSASDTITIFEEKAEASLLSIAPLYANVSDEVTYASYMSNTGTVDFTGAVWTNVIPEDVEITSFTLYTESNRMNTYSIYITTSENPTTEILILEDIEGVSTRNFDLTPYLLEGDKVESIIIKADTVFSDSYYSILYLFGNISSTAIQDETLVSYATLTAESSIESIDYKSSANTIVNDTSLLQIQKYMSSTELLEPLDEIYVTLYAQASSSGIVNPIFIDYLPEGLEYLPDTSYFRYSDTKTGLTYYSDDETWPENIPIPKTEVIKDYNDTGRTFLRWDFSGFTVPFLNALVVSFDVIVSVEPPTNMVNVAYLGNTGDNTFLGSTSFEDLEDYDGDGIVSEFIAQSNSVDITALSSNIFKVEKFVKGEYSGEIAGGEMVASEFSSVGISYAGGTAEYKLEVTNSFKLDIRDIELVDILPYVGDTGVMLEDEARGSQFPVFLNSVVTAEIVNIIGEVVDPNPEIIVEYSMSTDPVRFGQDGGTIGTDDDWTITAPENLASVKSIKVSTGSDVVLETFDKLVVTFDVLLSEEAEIGSIAYNSFAVRTSDILEDGTIEPLLPVEPNKVALLTKSGDFSIIGNFVWFDKNGNGLYDEDESGMNGVIVELYSEKLELIESTATYTNPITETDGYYTFSNIAEGNYYVKFTALEDYKLTIQEKDEINGSKPNQETGFTDIISITAQGVNSLDIDAGLICNTAPTIYAEDRCVYQNEVFNPLYGVSAVDCNGESIELSEKNITENDVDMSEVGTYKIIYSVTSPTNGIETTKTIYIEVLEANAYHQAVTDIIESVALQQTGISHILNAEGEKIQKALELGVSADELLLINASVEGMVNSLTSLEMVLHYKLETVCAGCKSCVIGSALEK